MRRFEMSCSPGRQTPLARALPRGGGPGMKEDTASVWIPPLLSEARACDTCYAFHGCLSDHGCRLDRIALCRTR